ncbi:hypothetical protein Glove_180g108 [Diversispora epigaea]|uniref:Protein kinase domain-containing protein n=1 Tax=Diversispora epigaea TaxID=1348612 RepID=A0A397IN96_9GLOM|nr:hypothetical protein Glove_180g108 [Diversispora epigaea]
MAGCLNNKRKGINNMQLCERCFAIEQEHLVKKGGFSQIYKAIWKKRVAGVTKNFAFILEYAQLGDLNHFVSEKFEKFVWNYKICYLWDIIEGIKKLFKYQPYSYASDIYSLGMIMWQLTSGHRPFHDQEHGPKFILDILDGKRPEITEGTLLDKYPSQRPTTIEIYKIINSFNVSQYTKKFYQDVGLEFNEAENRRLEMHPNSRYYGTSLNSMSNDNFDIMNINSNQEHSNCNSSVAENSKKHFLNEENNFKRIKMAEYFADNDTD